MFMRVFAGVLLSFCFAFSSWAAEAGKGISIFIAYTGIKPILEAFTRDTGIEVDYLEMSSGEVLTRIRAAKGKAQADAWFGGGLDSYIAAAEEGFLEPYVSPERAAYDPMFYNAEGLWSGISPPRACSTTPASCSSTPTPDPCPVKPSYPLRSTRTPSVRTLRF